MRVGGNKQRSGMSTGNTIMVGNKERMKKFNDPNKVFIGNLQWNTTEQELKDLCSSYGDVVHCKLVMNRFTGLSKVRLQILYPPAVPTQYPAL